MKNLKSDSIVKLFNPVAPSNDRLPKVDLKVEYGYSSSFPKRYVQRNEEILKKFIKKISDPDYAEKLKENVKAYSELFRKQQILKTCAEVEALKDKAEGQGYIEILKVYFYFLLLSRFEQTINSKYPNIDNTSNIILTLRSILGFDHRQPNIKKLRLISCRIGWAIYLVSNKKLKPSHLNNIFRTDPLFTFEFTANDVFGHGSEISDDYTSPNLRSLKQNHISLYNSGVQIEEEISSISNHTLANVNSLAEKYEEVYIRKNRKATPYKSGKKQLFRLPDRTINRVSNIRATPKKDEDLLTKIEKVIPDKKEKKSKKNEPIGDIIPLIYKKAFDTVLYNKIITSFAENKNEEIAIVESEEKANEEIKKIDFGIVCVQQEDQTNDSVYQIFDKYNSEIRNKRISSITIKRKDGRVDRFLIDSSLPSSVNTLTANLRDYVTDLNNEINRVCLNLQSERIGNPTLYNYYENNYQKRSFATISIGVGELAVLRKKWIGWRVGNGKYKVLNRMKGAKKVLYEEKVVSTTIDTTQEIREVDKKTTERRERLSKEIDKAINKTIQKDLSLQAGLSASYSTGFTSIEANAQFAFAKSTSKTTNENRRYANEIVTKACNEVITETEEKIQEIYNETIKKYERIIDKAEDDQCFVLAEVDDVFEFEVVRWNNRLILEMYIPEPSIGFIEQFLAKKKDTPPPTLFNKTAQEIEVHDWLCLKTAYPEVNIPSPPDLMMTGHFINKTAPVEEAEAWSEDIIDGQVEVPAGYIPEKVCVSISARGSSEYKNAKWAVSVAGRTIINGSQAEELVKEQLGLSNGRLGVYDYEYSFCSSSGLFTVGNTSNILWTDSTLIESIPISFDVRGHFDKASFINMMFYFRRTQAAIEKWQAEVYSIIKSADEERIQKYEAMLRSQRFDVNIDKDAFVDEENVKSELRSWFLKGLYGKSSKNSFIEQNTLAENAKEPFFANESNYLDFLQFNECFDWDNMRYKPLDKKDGNRELLEYKNKIKSANHFVDKFVQASAARVSVPVIPDNELLVLNFLNLRNKPNETEPSTIRLIERAKEDTNLGDSSSAIQSFDVLADIYTNLPGDEEFAHGVGELIMTENSNKAELDLSSSYMTEIGVDLWIPSNHDKGRVLMIKGILFTIDSVDDDGKIVLDKDWEQGACKTGYLIGALRIGSTWREQFPSGQFMLYTKDEFEKYEVLEKNEV